MYFSFIFYDKATNGKLKVNMRDLFLKQLLRFVSRQQIQLNRLNLLLILTLSH